MKIKLLIVFATSTILLSSCGSSVRMGSTSSADANKSTAAISDKAGASESPLSADEKEPNSAVVFQTKEPKTVMDFFALLPEKYFTLEGCVREDDKDCSKARAEYLKNYKEIEDIPNGYFKGGCDGGQRCIEMALFKRPDDSYVVAVATFGEMLDENHFLDYDNGKWKDISVEIVPEFSTDKRYEIPRNGTTVQVFSTKLIEKVDDYEVREKDKKLYDLVWKDGKFAKKT